MRALYKDFITLVDMNSWLGQNDPDVINIETVYNPNGPNTFRVWYEVAR